MTQENMQLVNEHARAIQDILVKDREDAKNSTANCLLLFDSGEEQLFFAHGTPLEMATSVAMACHKQNQLKGIFSMGISVTLP